MPPAHALSLPTDAGLDDAQFRIRDARPDDCPALYRLIYQLAEYSGMTEKVTNSPEKLRQDGFGAGHPPRFSALVIERLGESGTQPLELVGYSIYTEKYSTWKGRILWIEDLFISEPYRKYGLGGGLMRKLASIAKKSTMDRIEWCVLRMNPEAIAFYQSVGAYDLTSAEDWLLYRFNADKFKEYLARPWTRGETIKIL